jgi:putative addiction module killer protein
VEGKPHVVEHYLTAGGRDPFQDWLKRLRDLEGRARINLRIDRIEEKGQFGKTRHVGEGVYELKMDFGPGYRVYFGRDGETVVVLLGGGDKSTQERDIQAAIERWRDYCDA